MGSSNKRVQRAATGRDGNRRDSSTTAHRDPKQPAIVAPGAVNGFVAASQRTFRQQIAQPFRQGTGQLDRLGGVGQRKLGVL